MTELYPELTDQLVKRARKYYPNVRPYHNWRHARDVMYSTKKITSLATDPEVKENKELLVVAAAWHDANYYKDLVEKETREERSATLARISLPELAKEQRRLVSDFIIDTTVAKVEKSSLSGAVLATADAGYFAADYHSFVNRLGFLHAEEGHHEWKETVERTRTFGGHVIELSHKTLKEATTPRIADGWVKQIRSNLNRLGTTLNETTV